MIQDWDVIEYNIDMDDTTSNTFNREILEGLDDNLYTDITNAIY